ARNSGLPITEVVQPPSGEEPIGYTGEGVAINSPLIDGLATAEAKQRIVAWLEEQGVGRGTVNYKLRDWLFSRQRYWGEPFPIIWQGGNHEAIPETELPLVPPALDDFKPTGTGEPPLARAKEWVRYSEKATRELNTMPQWAGSCWYYLRFCDPKNKERFIGAEAERYWMTAASGSAIAARKASSSVPVSSEPGSLSRPGAQVSRPGAPVLATPGSGFPEPAQPSSEAAPVFSSPVQVSVKSVQVPPRAVPGEPETEHGRADDGHEVSADTTTSRASAHLSPGSAHVSPRPVPVFPSGGVDLYVGGTEHAVLHLLYARFWHKVLFDLGYLSTAEPFQRLVNQGIILGEDGRKMSKRWGNVIDPLDVIAEYGADAFRCYEMFMGPLEQMKPWSTTGVEGVARFLARVWRLVMEENQAGEWVLSRTVQEVEPTRAQLKVIHATIKKVGEDIEALSFNTAIAQMMIFVNAFTTAHAVPVSALRRLLILLNPFAPHLTSELWEILAGRFPISPDEITDQPWPEYRPEFLVEDEVEIALQVNGKVRGRITVPIAATSAELEAIALTNDRVRQFTAGLTIRKVVVIEKKLVNVVAK
ncbi:MAG TPA: class I tRNA ligase family protein, partial [Chthoniobacterales bacterium]|nr:class I tRNA ligase family protein [Chthoniobacterales bacterium]